MKQFTITQARDHLFEIWHLLEAGERVQVLKHSGGHGKAKKLRSVVELVARPKADPPQPQHTRPTPVIAQLVADIHALESRVEQLERQLGN